MTLFVWTLRILFQFLLPSSHCSILPFFCHLLCFVHTEAWTRDSASHSNPLRSELHLLYVDIKNSVFHHLFLVSFLDRKWFQPLWTPVNAVVVVIISHYYFYCQHLISSHRHVFSIVKKIHYVISYFLFTTHISTANKFEEVFSWFPKEKAVHAQCKWTIAAQLTYLSFTVSEINCNSQRLSVPLKNAHNNGCGHTHTNPHTLAHTHNAVGLRVLGKHAQLYSILIRWVKVQETC